MSPIHSRRLENTSNGASKFWEVDVKGREAHVTYGRIGSAGKETVKTFATPAEAQAFAEKKIAEKLRGGYSADDAFDSSSAGPVVLGAAASAPTLGGVLQTRLNQAAIPPTVNLKEHYGAVAYQLPRLVDGFATLIKELKAYQPKGQNSPLASLYTLDPALIPALEAKQKTVLDFVQGPAKPLMATPLSGNLSRAQLQPIHDSLLALSKWTNDGIKLPAMMPNTWRLLELVQAPIRFAASDLPNLDALTAPRLTAKAFAKLSEPERFNILENAERNGYVKEDLGDDEAQVKALIGDAGVKKILSHILEAIEEETEQWPDEEDDIEISAPSIASLNVVKSGSEILGYEVETHVNWQPADIDRIGKHMIMPDGTLFGEDVR
jgi:predicted DNA-binding WGR domain protein